MANISVLSAFNNHLIEFVDDVYKVFPEDDDIGATKQALLTIKKNNPKLLLQMWKEQISDLYNKEITAGDISFFINKNYDNDISDYDTTGEIQKKIDILREPVRNMGKENQDKAMKYIQNLTKLANLY